MPKKVAPENVRHSRWLITINANRKTGTYPGGEEALRERLVLCAKLFERSRLKPYLYIMKKEDSYEKNVGTRSKSSPTWRRATSGGSCTCTFMSPSPTPLRAASPTRPSAPRAPRSWASPSRTSTPSWSRAARRSSRCART